MKNLKSITKGSPVFNEQQKEMLAQKLDKKHVKQRKGGAGKSLSYIEAWHAIDEANRIFGYDRWNRHLIRLECVEASERGDGKKGYMAHYIATVRIEVQHPEGLGKTIFRDGTGYGNSYGFTQGEAHEVAVKEAESDAMKRALMTFGNPFGLALYDKAQAQVGTDVPEIMTEKPRLPERVELAKPADNGEAEVKKDFTLNYTSQGLKAILEEGDSQWAARLDSFAIIQGEAYRSFDAKDYYTFLKVVDVLKKELNDDSWYKNLAGLFGWQNRTDAKGNGRGMTLFHCMLVDELIQRAVTK